MASLDCSVGSIMLTFSSSESIHLTVPNLPVPFRRYLEQPQRLGNALMNPKQVLELDHQHFRLCLRGFTFLMLHIQPVVYLSIVPDNSGKLWVKSTGCEIQGNEYINQYFDLALTGYLELTEQAKSTRLLGQADLQVDLEIPPMLYLAPTPLLQATGDRIVKSTLHTMKQRLASRLATHYAMWNQAQAHNRSEIGAVSEARQ